VAHGIAGLGSAAPTLTLGVIAAASLGGFFTFLQPLDSGVEAVLSIDLGDADPTFAILAAFGLGALSIGLMRAKHDAWWLAVATLVAALFGQSDALHHPLGIIVVGGVLAVLLADRHRYSVKTDTDWRRMIAALLMVVAIAIGIETSLVIAASGSWPAPLAALGYATAALGNAFGINDDAAGQLLRGTSLNALLVLLLLGPRACQWCWPLWAFWHASPSLRPTHRPGLGRTVSVLGTALAPCCHSSSPTTNPCSARPRPAA
jgi:hypothetical protein